MSLRHLYKNRSFVQICKTHPTTWGKSPCREQAALRSCRSLRGCEPRQHMWAVCSSERRAWSLPPPEGTWPGQQQHQPAHQPRWLSTERWSPLHPCEGGLSWTQRQAKIHNLHIFYNCIQKTNCYIHCVSKSVSDFCLWYLHHLAPEMSKMVENKRGITLSNSSENLFLLTNSPKAK